MIDNLTEAIAHAKKVAENVKYNANTFTESDLLDENCRQAKAECLECAAEHEQLAAWLEELKARREADRWIPVTERLPEKAGEYLCTLHYAIPPYHMFHPEKDVYVDAINVQGFDGTAFVSSVTHWKPLPKPYESEAENFDYQRAVEDTEYCERHEPTYNSDDGSM